MIEYYLHISKSEKEVYVKLSKKTSVTYKAIKFIIKKLYPKITVVGKENIPQEASIIVGNHSQLHGPIISELYSPVSRYTWCAAQMMKLKEVPAYAFDDFWSRKSKYSQPFYKAASYLIAPISVCLFNNANTVPVYHDARILTTFKETLKLLSEDEHVVIFPEHDAPHNHIVYDFQDRFVDIARMYYRKTGVELSFVPTYIAPKIKQMHFGSPIKFDHSAPIEDERKRICSYLMNEITEIAEALPEHTVVPYRNIKKSDYPTNSPKKDK